MSLEKDILDTIDGAMSPTELRQALEARGIVPWEQDFRDAIWNLIHRGELTLRNDRKVEKATNDWFGYDL